MAWLVDLHIQPNQNQSPAIFPAGGWKILVFIFFMMGCSQHEGIFTGLWDAAGAMTRENKIYYLGIKSFLRVLFKESMYVARDVFRINCNMVYTSSRLELLHFVIEINCLFLQSN